MNCIFMGKFKGFLVIGKERVGKLFKFVLIV